MDFLTLYKDMGKKGQDEDSGEYLFSAPRTLSWDTAATLEQSLSCGSQPRKATL